ncbi:MAG: hypothetical protein MJ016_03795 [Victivallaceae bacterium]|nr:hypothetical protein [Victivallaceae bacterium]
MERISDFIQKHHWGFLVLLIVFLIANATYLSIPKTHLFLDEYYSYGLANCADHPFLDNKETSPRSVSGEYFTDYLKVSPDHRFDYRIPYRNQVADVHPPLFYFLLHTACSFFPGTYSKWYGLSVNYIAFIVTIVFLYLLALRFFDGKIFPAYTVILLWGGTMLGIQNILYLRMYAVLSMFAVILFFLHRCLLETKKFPLLLVLIGVTAYFGYMTQYYFLILAFFLACSYCIFYFYRKNWEKLIAYAATMLVSVLLFFVTFPAVFEHLFGGREVGATTLNNITLNGGVSAARNTGGKILFFCKDYLNGIHCGWANGFISGAVIVLFMLFFFAITCKRGSSEQYKKFWHKSLWILAPVVPTFLVIALVCIYFAQRYVYWFYPIITLYVVYVVIFCLGSLKNSAQGERIFFILALAVVILQSIFSPLPKTYRGNQKRFDYCVSKIDCPAIAFCWNERPNSMLTQSCMLLSHCKKTTICKIDHSENMFETAANFTRKEIDRKLIVGYHKLVFGFNDDEIDKKVFECRKDGTEKIDFIYDDGFSRWYYVEKK